MKPRRVIVCSLIEIVTTRPPPALSMRGTTSRATRNVPVALVSSTSRKPAGGTSQNGCGSVMNRGLTVRIPIPALLTRRSRPPSIRVGAVDRRRHRAGVADVELESQRSGAQLRGGGLRPFPIAAGHRDPGARLHERVRHRPPQAARAAGHQDAGAAQPRHRHVGTTPPSRAIVLFVR